jgi:lysophospholipase L1-like esterase
MKRLLLNILLAITSVTVTIGACEIAARVVGYTPEPEAAAPLIAHSRGRGFWLMPAGVDWPEHYSKQPVRVNNYGLRGPHIDRPTPGRPRVLFVGDSVTFGYGLPEELTYVHLLNGRSIGGSPPIEAVNAAIAGWSARQYRTFLDQYTDALQPDVIVIGVVLNDLVELLNGIRDTVDHNALTAINVLTVLSRKLASIKVLKDAYVHVADPRGREIRSVRELAEQPDTRAAREAMAAHIEELTLAYEAAARRNIGFGLVLFPFDFQLTRPELDAPQRRMRRFADEFGIPVLDLLEPLRTYPPLDVMLDFDPVHFSAKGNAVIADAIADWLARERLVHADGN